MVEGIVTGDRAAGATPAEPHADGPRVLVVDNYDSFVYNLVHYLAQLGARVDVVRNDDALFDTPGWSEPYDGILLSPGPGAPAGAGACLRIIAEQAGHTPIFGVCLGLQAIGEAYGATVSRAPELRHGKTSTILHHGVGCLHGLPEPFTATRYHSLAVEPDTVPDVLEVTATTEDGVVMALRHRKLAVEGVQFHPESVLSQGGHLILGNWLAVCGDPSAPARAAGMSPLVHLR